MKKHILALIITAFCAIGAFSKDIHIDVMQFPAKPGSKYDTDLATPLVVYEKLRDGKMNLRYNFSMDAEKDDKNNLINMKIEFPSGVKYSVLAFDGIQAFELDGEQVPALLEHETYAECFIPVRKGGSGFIEMQLNIPKNYLGSDIPVKVNFDGYKKKNVTVLEGILSVVGIVSVGVVVAVPVIAGYFYKKNSVKVALIEEKFSEIKKKYKKISMADSMKRFRIQVR